MVKNTQLKNIVKHFVQYRAEINFVGKIQYIFKNTKRTYYHDFYIKSTNTIIEVKSQWTFDKWKEKNLAKQKACLEQGFNFEFIIL